MSVRRLALALLLVPALAPGAAAPATAALPAHAQLVSSTPADGDSVPTADEVTLSFSEDVNAQFVQVRVEGPRGDETAGEPEVDGTDVVQQLLPDLPDGEHRVTYRVVSVDGHPVSGTLAFTTTGTGSGGSPTVSATPSEPESESPSPSTTTPPAATQRPTPTPSTDPVSASSGSTPGWVLALLIGLIGLVVLAAGALLVGRRRDTGEEPPS
jgi:methionine-rich copper-binding protein CopC